MINLDTSISINKDANNGINVAIVPFKISAAVTTIPAFVPKTRNAFVAPILLSQQYRPLFLKPEMRSLRPYCHYHVHVYRFYKTFYQLLVRKELNLISN